MKKYLSGQINEKELCNIVDNRLFLLRIDSPELTEEEEFLAGIELICEEIKDGFRTSADLEEYIKSSLIPDKPAVSWNFTATTGNSQGIFIFSSAVSREIEADIFTPDFGNHRNRVLSR